MKTKMFLLKMGMLASLLALAAIPVSAATLPVTATSFTLYDGKNQGQKVYVNSGPQPNVTLVNGSIGSNDNAIEAYWSTTDASIGGENGTGNGFAIIKGNPINNVTFGVYNGYFGGLEFSLKPDVDSVFTVTATFKNGTESISGISVNHNALKDFLVKVNDSNNPFKTITIQATTGGFYQIKQWMVSDVQPVPLPAAAYLFGSALLGMVGIGYRRNKKQA